MPPIITNISPETPSAFIDKAIKTAAVQKWTYEVIGLHKITIIDNATGDMSSVMKELMNEARKLNIKISVAGNVYTYEHVVGSVIS